MIFNWFEAGTHLTEAVPFQIDSSLRLDSWGWEHTLVGECFPGGVIALHAVPYVV